VKPETTKPRTRRGFVGKLGARDVLGGTFRAQLDEQWDRLYPMESPAASAFTLKKG